MNTSAIETAAAGLAEAGGIGLVSAREFAERAAKAFRLSPKRIQMSRQRPWRADNPDAVIVARPSMWGNPWRITREACDIYLDGGLCWVVQREGRRSVQHEQTEAEARDAAVDQFRVYLTAGLLPITVEDVRRELAGRDLACWCSLDRLCHADVLLELANA